MSFEPCNAEHAIGEVGFVLVLSRPFSEADIDAIQAGRNAIRPDLPAISRSDDSIAIQFGYLRPNGSPVWQVRVAGNSISIDCTRYTRWARVSERALRYAYFVLQTCAIVEELKIDGVGLAVIDRFEAEAEAYDPKTLLVASDLLPRSLFERGALWSVEQRWPAMSTRGMTTSTLEIESRKVRRFDREAGETNRLSVVKIEHGLEVWFSDPPVMNKSKEHDGYIKDAFDELHILNKNTIDQLLTEEMKRKIGLWSEA